MKKTIALIAALTFMTGNAFAQVSQKAGSSGSAATTQKSSYRTITVSQNRFSANLSISGYPVNNTISQVYNPYGAFVALKSGALPPGFNLSYDSQRGHINLVGNTYVGTKPYTPAGTYKFTIRAIGVNGQQGGNYANNHNGDFQDIDVTLNFTQPKTPPKPRYNTGTVYR